MNQPVGERKVAELDMHVAPWDAGLISVHAYYSCDKVPDGFEAPGTVHGTPFGDIQGVKLRVIFALKRDTEVGQILKDQTTLKLGIKARIARTGDEITAAEKTLIIAANKRFAELICYEGLTLENLEWDHRFFYKPGEEPGYPEG